MLLLNNLTAIAFNFFGVDDIMEDDIHRQAFFPLMDKEEVEDLFKNLV